MKDAAKSIAALRASQPVRQPDDPLRAFMSLVVMRDHARLLKLTLRKMHVGEKVRNGDLHLANEGQLVRVSLRWWQRRYKLNQYLHADHYRIE